VRTKGILFLLLILVFVVLISMIFTDRWLENQMESVGSSIVGASVEFEGVDFSFLKLRVKWDSLKVTNPDNTWQNLFETGFTEFDLDPVPLFSKKVIIENVEMEGLRFNTPRKSDGRLVKSQNQAKKSKIVAAVENRLTREAATMPVFNLQQYTRKINLDSLWKMVDLRTPGRVDSLRKVFTQDYQTWQQRIEDLPSRNEINRLTSEVQIIKLDQIKSVEGFQSAYNQTKQVRTEIDSLYHSVQTLKSNFNNDMSRIKQSRSVVSNWIGSDYQRALQVARIPDISMKNMGRLLFGQRIINQIQMILKYIGEARYYAEKVKSPKPEKESPPRLKGQNIYFAPHQMMPKYWIKQISMSGEAWHEMKISGKVENIVSRQTVIDKPTTITISGSRRDQAALNLKGTLDYREDTPRENIFLNLQQIPLANVKLTNFPLLAQRIEKGKGEINAELNFKGSDFLADIGFNASNLAFGYSTEKTDLNPQLQNLSRSLIKSLNNITVDALASQTAGDFRFKVTSNIDNLLAARVKEIVSDEVERVKSQIENRVQKEVEDRRAQLDSLMNNQEQDLRARIEEIEQELNKQKQVVADKQKEIEQQIAAKKKELENKAGEEAKKKLKDLFKK
jgi:uncharacterized protein (TIGR03545 family)